MKKTCYYLGILVVASLLCQSGAWAVAPEAGINAAGLIEFPTALDQTLDHTFHFTTEIVDIGEPDLRLENLRYGYQLGNFQLLFDIHGRTEPERDFDYGEVRAKLRVLPLDEYSTDIAIGLLGRETDDDQGRARIDDRSASLFGVVTSRFFLLEATGPLLVNFYLDNLFASLGAKLEFYQFIMAVAEVDYLHSLTEAEDRAFGKIGLEIQGEQNFYFQVVYADRNENLLFQVGSGF
jgi:hypothetical protein